MSKEKIDEITSLRHKAHCITMASEDTQDQWSDIIEDIMEYIPTYVGTKLDKILDKYMELDNDVSQLDYIDLKDEANEIIEDWLEIHNEKPSGIARANLKV